MKEKSSSGFFKEVYRLIAEVPRGRVATYGQIAALAGRPTAARYVGFALSSSPDGLELPYHRIVNRTGILAPDPVFGDQSIQRKLLRREGITFLPDGRINMKKHLWK